MFIPISVRTSPLYVACACHRGLTCWIRCGGAEDRGNQLRRRVTTFEAIGIMVLFTRFCRPLKQEFRVVCGLVVGEAFTHAMIYCMTRLRTTWRSTAILGGHKLDGRTELFIFSSKLCFVRRICGAFVWSLSLWTEDRGVTFSRRRQAWSLLQPLCVAIKLVLCTSRCCQPNIGESVQEMKQAVGGRCQAKRRPPLNIFSRIRDSSVRR